jgi:23S rRNA pseudouridine2605 synthase
VSLNGRIRRDPETPTSGERDQIAVDGKLVEPREKAYLMMNKPRGIVTTASDEEGRETVYDVLHKAGSKGRRVGAEDSLSWVAPVGRLDKASEGLLLLTNDSEWGARIAAPETHLDKTYHVQVAAVADESFAQELVRGVRVKDGVLDEGKNRQIRRMIEGMGVEVLRLIRVAIGPLQLGDLVKGEHRPLTQDEKRMLDRAARGKAS